MESHPKLEAIRNMLAKAEDPAATPAEAEAFTAGATRLMAKYGIEQAMIDAARGRNVRAVVADRRITCVAPYATEKVSLIDGLAKAMGMRCIQLSTREAPGQKVCHVFGFASDLDRMEMLYTSLLLQQVSAMRAAETGDRPYYESVKAWRRSFLNGFAQAVRRRVAAAEADAASEAQAEAPAAGASVALVVADRTREVEAALKTAYPRVRTTYRSLSGSGGYAGRAAGERANIGGASVGGGRSALGR